LERGGFEPPKAEPTDLQSVPFGHSGTSPDFSWRRELNPRPEVYKTPALPLSYSSKDSKYKISKKIVNYF
jgi:hypothetical protein